MEIVRGSGESATVMPNTRGERRLVAKGVLRLRQRPGPDNSLGLVKFMLPNPYNVYLHCTPAPSAVRRIAPRFQPWLRPGQRSGGARRSLCCAILRSGPARKYWRP